MRIGVTSIFSSDKNGYLIDLTFDVEKVYLDWIEGRAVLAVIRAVQVDDNFAQQSTIKCLSHPS